MRCQFYFSKEIFLGGTSIYVFRVWQMWLLVSSLAGRWWLCIFLRETSSIKKRYVDAVTSTCASPAFQSFKIDSVLVHKDAILEKLRNPVAENSFPLQYESHRPLVQGFQLLVKALNPNTSFAMYDRCISNYIQHWSCGRLENL
jgi:hypothetical protein